MVIKTLTVLMVFLMCGAQVTAVRAAETLHFNNDISRSSFERIKSYVSNDLGQNIATHDIAKIDLNNDGLYEFILRPSGCDQGAKCNFIVLAESGSKIRPLGRFEGINLLLGTEFSHGIRNLLVFNSVVNDFDYNLYTWHPKASAYRKSGS